MKKFILAIAAVLLLSQAALAGGKTLVVYYSASGTTEKAAKLLAKNLGADLFAVECAQPYSEADWDWTNKNSRASREYADPKLRKVELKTTKVEGWATYDTVYLGYPIWWGIAAWPLTSFVAANDFKGKTVIPFATAASSGIGNSGKLLEKEAGSGTWLEGTRFYSSKITEEEVQKWLSKLKK